MRIPRSSGVLLHLTALPGPFGIGDLGPRARLFIDWLAEAGVRWWQILPLTPPGGGNSPYSGRSALATNPALISPEDLLAESLLTPEDLQRAPNFPEHRVDYGKSALFKDGILRKAFSIYEATTKADPSPISKAFDRFLTDQEDWLSDYALLLALSREHGSDWRQWPSALRDRNPTALSRTRKKHPRELAFHAFSQFLVHRQWEELKRYAHDRGVGLIGDAPIFVSGDSVDVWTHRKLFSLDQNGYPTKVSGVPPDPFTEEGQLWGHPLYEWERIARDDYSWWRRRMAVLFSQVDVVRIDHFRGFEAYWEIDADAKTAVDGRWTPGPGKGLFQELQADFATLKVIAEDLGTITSEVEQLRQDLGLPGMSVLQFGFAGDEGSVHRAHRVERDRVVYTGTHDNNTALGWFHEDLTDSQRHQVREYLRSDGREIHWDLIRLAFSTVADLVVVPFQDIAGLGSDCRTNTPGKSKGQWEFRAVPWMFTSQAQKRLRTLVHLYDRHERITSLFGSAQEPGEALNSEVWS